MQLKVLILRLFRVQLELNQFSVLEERPFIGSLAGWPILRKKLFFGFLLVVF